ncbi:Phosphatidylglycerophosphatase GEP4 [Colletotrichum spinosum]|uniref:Phosphatidylglycerophosphatase GEP4 n=1 Tax=Colletotrichum spinosum TaxID=1347390 RepID=A0A4R8Q3J6_9PEZI|nr:Phosphatidylglycerophosphatase GEP4 [Colletotrichum spinosum]
MNLNLSGSFNVFKLLFKPALCLPHYTAATFNDLPIPLSKAFEGQNRKCDIRAVVLDKDDCFAVPHTNEVHKPYKERFEQLKAAYPGRRLVIVSNTAGATSYDTSLKLAKELEEATGVTVLPHKTKKPGCGSEIMEYFKSHPETGVSHPSHVAVVGDRLTTDMMLANMMGGWGFWIKDGVVPPERKSIFSRLEFRLAPALAARGHQAIEPQGPLE